MAGTQQRLSLSLDEPASPPSRLQPKKLFDGAAIASEPSLSDPDLGPPDWDPGYVTPPRMQPASSDAPESLSPPDVFSPLSPNENNVPVQPPSPVRTNGGFLRRDSFLRLQNVPTTPRSLWQPKKALPAHLFSEHKSSSAPTSTIRRPEANVNPFTPQSARPKRTRAAEDSIEPRSIFNGYESPSKRRCQGASSNNISRYNEEFVQLAVIGTGEFGTVYKCRNRLDGLCYAIKRSKKPISGLCDEQNLLREVYAHAVLSVHKHIVRYFSAWEEENHMLIQNEFCDRGSLAMEIDRRRSSGCAFKESEVVTVLRHIAQGLRLMHSKHLVHLDVKPGNIFLKTEDMDLSPTASVPPATPTCSQTMEVSATPAAAAAAADASEPMSVDKDSQATDDDEDGASTNIFSSVLGSLAMTPTDQLGARVEIVYKLGDLGHVTHTDDPHVEEGDCRYMPKELLEDDFRHLPKADIFSLGMTVYEMASCETLPKNGERWHELRSDNVPVLSRYSLELNSLIRSMIHPTPESRPSADQILQHPALVIEPGVQMADKSKLQLFKELNAEKRFAQQLYRELLEAKGQTASNQSSPAENPLAGPGKKPARRGSAPTMTRHNTMMW